VSPISTAVYAAFDGERYYHYMSPNGRTRQPLGCSHKSPKEVRRHVANVDPYVSPMRSESEATTPTVTPLAPDSSSDVDGVASSPEPRRRGSR
jgi:hypothetical protein